MSDLKRIDDLLRGMEPAGRRDYLQALESERVTMELNRREAMVIERWRITAKAFGGSVSPIVSFLRDDSMTDLEVVAERECNTSLLDMFTEASRMVVAAVATVGGMLGAAGNEPQSQEWARDALDGMVAAVKAQREIDNASE